MNVILMWHMPHGITLAFSLVFPARQLWCICDTENQTPGVYKNANFSQSHQYCLDSCHDNISSSTSLDFSTACFSWSSHSQSTRACSVSPRASQLFLVSVFCVYHWSGHAIAPCLIPEQWVFWGCSIPVKRAQVASPLEWALDNSHLCCKQTDNCHRT